MRACDLSQARTLPLAELVGEVAAGDLRAVAGRLAAREAAGPAALVGADDVGAADVRAGPLRAIDREPWRTTQSVSGSTQPAHMPQQTPYVQAMRAHTAKHSKDQHCSISLTGVPVGCFFSVTGMQCTPAAETGTCKPLLGCR